MTCVVWGPGAMWWRCRPCIFLRVLWCAGCEAWGVWVFGVKLDLAVHMMRVMGRCGDAFGRASSDQTICKLQNAKE